MLACSLCLSSQLNKQIKSLKMFKDSPQGREDAVSWPQQEEPQSPWVRRGPFSCREGQSILTPAVPRICPGWTLLGNLFHGGHRGVWCCITWGTGMGACFWANMLHIQFLWLFSRQLILPAGLKNKKSKYPVQNCPSGRGHRCLLTWSWSHLGKNTWGMIALSDAQEQSPLYLLPL